MEIAPGVPLTGPERDPEEPGTELPGQAGPLRGTEATDHSPPHKESPPEGWDLDSRPVQVQHRPELLTKQKAFSCSEVGKSVSGIEEKEKNSKLSQPHCANWIKEQLLSASGAISHARSHAFCLLLGEGLIFSCDK